MQVISSLSLAKKRGGGRKINLTFPPKQLFLILAWQKKIGRKRKLIECSFQGGGSVGPGGGEVIYGGSTRPPTQNHTHTSDSRGGKMPAKKNIKLGNSASARQGGPFRDGEFDLLSFRILFRGGKTVVTKGRIE